MSTKGGALSTRRRIYLLRHAEVAYFDEDGQPVAPDEVPLTPAGRHQAERAGAPGAGAGAAGRPGARGVAGGVPRGLPGVLAGPSRFLGGETIDELFDRVLPALDRLLGDPSWDPAYLAGRSTAMEELWAQYRGPRPA